MPELRTERLILAALTLVQLRYCLEEPARLNWPLAPLVIDRPVRQAIHAKTLKMTHAPVPEHPWYTYWLIVTRSRHLGVGMIGFKGAPNYLGEVEIGYGIAPAYEGRGYTTEAARALIAWAFAAPGCLVVRALTDKTNLASQRILQKVGMQLEQEREQDFIWRIRKGNG